MAHFAVQRINAGDSFHARQAVGEFCRGLEKYRVAVHQQNANSIRT